MTTNEKTEETFELKKKIGLWSSTSILCGVMIGSGIFVSPVGVLAGMQGSVGLSLVMWIACGLLSWLSALCYAELGCCIRESGSDFIYHYTAIGPLVAFLFSWTGTVVVRGGSVAAAGLVFGTYAVKPFFPNCQPPSLPIKLIAGTMIMVIIWINCRSVKAAAKTQIIFTVTKFFVLVVIVISGIVSIVRDGAVAHENFKNAFAPATVAKVTARDVVITFYQGLFAYSGFGMVNFITEEVKDIKKNLPGSIMISMITVTLAYIIMNVVYFGTLTIDEMLLSKAVAVTFAEKNLGSFAWIIPVGVCISVFGSLNGSILTGPRVQFVAARHGHLPDILSMIHVHYYTPSPALIFIAIYSLITLLPNDFDSLLNSFTFANWIFNGLCAVDILILRRTRPNMDRPYKVSILVPIIVTIVSAGLVVIPLMNSKNLECIYAAAFIALGVPVYYFFVYKKKILPGMCMLTRFLQKLMNVAPTDWEEVQW